MPSWIVIAIVCCALGLGLLVSALAAYLLHRKEAARCTAQTGAVVTGVAEQRPGGTREEGEVPALALQAWGFAAGHDLSFAGNLLNALSRQRFYPCVRFYADGAEHVRIGFVPARRGVFQPGQSVEVHYDPENPRCFRVAEAEPAARSALWGQVAGGIVLLAAGCVCFLLR